MDIKGQVYIWVTDVKLFEEGYILDGRAFDDEFGFGGEDIRRYSGNVLIVSNNGSINLSSEIGLIHISRKGTLWTLDSKRLSATPFLLTSNTSIKHKYSGYVELQPSNNAKVIFDKFEKGIYPIVSNNFIGVITYENGAIWLDAFSDTNGEILAKEEVVSFSELGVEAGTIKRTE